MTSIEDRFGNTITYSYDADIPSPYTGRLAAKLGSISRNDGASVSFVYEQYENLFIVKEMNYGDRQITFDYVKPGFGPYTIDIVTDEEGRETNFDYYDVSAWLKTLTIPTGAKAEYNYQTTNPDQGLNGQVKWKKISGPDMETRNFTYLYRPDSSLHLYHADVFQSETDAINGQLIETVYTVKNRPTGTPFLPNEQALHTVTNGTVKQITVFYGGTPQLGDGDLVYSLVNSWVPVRHGDHGCQIHTQKNNQYKTCARPLLDKQVRTIYNGIDNITNVFTFDPYSFDQYGNPRKTRSFASYDGGDGSSRYVRQVYNNDVTNWLIGRTGSVSVSESDGNWTETYKRTYYAPSGVYKSLPHYDYTYGRWTKEFDEYHATGELKKILYNGTDRVEIYENYKRGVPQERQLPDMSVSLSSFTDEMVSSFSYVDDYGNVVKAVDFRGNTTDYAYDALDRLTGVDYGGSNWNDEVIQYFDNDGYEKKTVGNLREYRYYDGLGRTILERATDVSRPSDSRITTKTEYDKQGNVSFSSFPVNATPGEGIHYKYDALGRKIEENIPDTSTTRMWEYLSGHSVRVTDGLGNETLIAYEAHARPQYDKPVHIKQTVAEEGDEEDPPFPIDPPCEVACRSTTPAEYIETFIDYDVFDNRTSVTQAGKTTSYVYDNYKRLCKISRADVGDTAMEYSASGNMMWSLKGATGPSTACGSTSDVNKISYLYNQRGELHMKTGSSPYFLELYGSDQNGNIAGTIASTSGAKYYIYNDRNQPLTEYNQLTGSILRWNYNANGDVSSMVYPDGTVVDYQPDALGRPTQVGQFASNIKYHKTGALSEYTFGNGIKRVITRRDSGLVQSITDSIGNSTRFEHSYVFDEEQNLTSLIDSVQPSYNLSEFEYDSASRLTQVRGVWGLGEFEYDSMNNIDRMTLGSRVVNYNYNGKGQLSNVTGEVSRTFSYDTRGNVTGNGQRTFIYDQANQIITSDGIDLSYDAFGKRTNKVHNGQYTYFDYARNGNLYRKTNPDDSTVDYVYLNGNVIAEKESDGQSTRVNYLHSDSLGSVSLQTDDNAAVTKRYHYEPFGKAIESGQSDSPGYTGHVYDDDLSLTYMKARYYDSDVGRFYSNDPVGFTAINPASFNRYAYGNNNPYKYTDPDGEYAVAAPVVLVGLGGYILYRTYKAAKNVSNEVSSRPILVYKDQESDSDTEGSDSAEDKGTIGLAPDGKVHGELPTSEEIAEDDLERTDEVLGQSIETRSRENEEYPNGNPNGDDDDQGNFRRSQQHRERIADEQRLRERVRKRLRDQEAYKIH